jgi:uncharacterized protein YkwD
MPRTPLQGAAFLLGFWIALWLSPFGASGEPLSSSGALYADLEAGLHHGVNRVRTDRHLIPLERRPELDAVARAHSRDMANRHFFDHTNPEGEVAPDRLIRAQVRGFSLAAEKLGITDRPDPNGEILNGWIQSEVHRRNLFAPPFNATGIGIARAPNGSLIYTQIYVTYPR